LVLSASLFILQVVAVPIDDNQHHLLERVTRNGNDLPFYYPDSISNVATASSFVEPKRLTEEEHTHLAKSTISRQFNVKAKDLFVAHQYTDLIGVTHVFMEHMINNIRVANHNAAVHIKNGHVSSSTSSFSNHNLNLIATAPKSIEVIIPLSEAVKTAEELLDGTKDQIEATLGFLQISPSKLVYVHQFQVRNRRAVTWYHVSVDAHNGQVVQVVDYVRKASYEVIKLPHMTPLDGFSIVTNPNDKDSSPIGWHNDGDKIYKTTQGNNADVQIQGKEMFRPYSKNFTFLSNWHATQKPNSESDKTASAINLFYLINTMHDITYKFGFTEASGNFQTNNFGKGGKENDAVIGHCQSDEGTDNAYFQTPPDGQAGEMSMFIFDMTKPKRDGSLDNIIPMHEYTHGVSNRLTGGSHTGFCLYEGESAGMGEGWSDAVAVYLTRNENDTASMEVPIGWYVLGNNATGPGIRDYPYSTNMSTNPHLYSNLNHLWEAHEIGEVWATMLFELYWALVEKHGFTPNWDNASSKKGNIIAMQLLIGGLALQPCNPKFLDARDAILLADNHYYNGANKCEIWKSFAKRGLGIDAVQSKHVDGFGIPHKC
jgi:extracellular elastinolytic metalloproteinase